MTDSLEIRRELELAEQLIHDYLPVFVTRGFSYRQMHVETSKVVADSAVFHFENQSTGMKIRLAYFPPYHDIQRSFVLTITNRRGEKLYVNEYLRVHKRFDHLEKFTDKGNSTDFKAFWEKFFKSLEDLFSTDLKDILEAKEWENVPFNWGDYR